MTNQDYMKRALELAKKAMGYTSPNPMVGCVVVKDGRIVTEGYHERCGEYHAERNALTKCSEDLTGATMYVTLEPCCHQGKTPPFLFRMVLVGIMLQPIRFNASSNHSPLCNTVLIIFIIFLFTILYLVTELFRAVGFQKIFTLYARN